MIILGLFSPCVITVSQVKTDLIASCRKRRKCSNVTLAYKNNDVEQNIIYSSILIFLSAYYHPSNRYMNKGTILLIYLPICSFALSLPVRLEYKVCLNISTTQLVFKSHCLTHLINRKRDRAVTLNFLFLNFIFKSSLSLFRLIYIHPCNLLRHHLLLCLRLILHFFILHLLLRCLLFYGCLLLYLW